MAKYVYNLFLLIFSILISTGCVPGEDGSGSANSFSVNPNPAYIAPSQSVRLLIRGGTPPFQVSAPSSLYGSVFLDSDVDSSIISVVANSDGLTGSIPITVTDAQGETTFATVFVSNSFTYTPVSRDIYPGRKGRISILNGTNPPYTFEIVEGESVASVDSNGLVSINEDAPTPSLVVVRITDNNGLSEESRFVVNERISADDVEMGLSGTFSCLAKTNNTNSTRNLQCWGTNTSQNFMGHPQGLFTNTSLRATQMPPVVVRSGGPPSQIAMSSGGTCALFGQAGNYSTSVVCWGDSLVAGEESGATPDSMITRPPRFFKGRDNSGAEIPLYVKKITAGVGIYMCALLTERFNDSASNSGDGLHNDEVRCWGFNDETGRLGINTSSSLGFDNVMLPTRTLSIRFNQSRVHTNQFYPNYVHKLGTTSTLDRSYSNFENSFVFNNNGSKVRADIDLDTGDRFSCAARSGPNEVTCWGWNRSNTVSATPGSVGGDLYERNGSGDYPGRINERSTFTTPSEIVSIHTGQRNACVILDSSPRRVHCWGSNQHRMSNPALPLSDNITFTPTFGVPAVTVRNSSGTELNVMYASSGENHTCFIANENLNSDGIGDVYCIGDNQQGQRGVGTKSDAQTVGFNPVRVNLGVYTSGSGQPVDFQAVKLVSIQDSICALLAPRQGVSGTGGDVKCWGQNDYNELGLGRTSDVTSPANDFTYSTGDIIDIAGSSSGFCVLKSSGDIQCWGQQTNGRLGHANQTVGLNNPQDPLFDVPFTNLLNPGKIIQSIKAYGSSNCVLYTDGQSNCFGQNFRGGLAVGSSNSIGTVPNNAVASQSIRPNPSGLTIKSMVTTGSNSCAIMSNDRVHCAGNYGTGINNTEFETNPFNSLLTFPNTPVPDLENKKALMISGGLDHVCGVFENTTTRATEIICWGNNEHGQLGQTTNTDRVGINLFPEDFDLTPTPLRNFRVAFTPSSTETILDIKSGANHNCILIADSTSPTNKVRCWGEASALGTDNDPSLGITPRYTATNFLTPPLNFDGLNPVEIALGSGFSCALFDTEVVRCWSSNSNSVLGPNPRSATPNNALNIDLGGGRSATRIFTGPSSLHVCATLDYDSDEDGRVDIKCWGSNGWGQLGTGDTDPRGNNSNQMGFALPLLKYRLE